MLPPPTRPDVHALQGDHPGLQVTDDEPPPTRLNGHSVDPEQRRPVTKRVEQDRSQHQPERSINADGSLEASAWEPGGELGDGTFPKRASDGRGAEQHQGTKVHEAQDQHCSERDPPPLGASSSERQV